MNGSIMRTRKKSKIPWNKWKGGHNNPKSLGHWENNHKREIHSITGLSQKARKSSNNLTSHLRELGKEQQKSPMWVEGRK